MHNRSRSSLKDLTIPPGTCLEGVPPACDPLSALLQRGLGHALHCWPCAVQCQSNIHAFREFAEAARDLVLGLGQLDDIAQWDSIRGHGHDG